MSESNLNYFFPTMRMVVFVDVDVDLFLFLVCLFRILDKCEQRAPAIPSERERDTLLRKDKRALACWLNPVYAFIGYALLVFHSP